MVETLLAGMKNFTSFSGEENCRWEVDDIETAKIPPTPGSPQLANNFVHNMFTTYTQVEIWHGSCSYSHPHELTLHTLSEPRQDRCALSISYRLIHNLGRIRINHLRTLYVLASTV